MFTMHRSALTGLDDESPDLASVRDALQLAIELEHSTIPLYLYALYSLDGERNAHAVEIVKSVVVEEMLHMVLAANVLNAIGGRPVIDSPDFTPHYPGKLPSGVEHQLTVHLRQCTLDQIGVFIGIEEPHDPVAAADAVTIDDSICTIGEFYQSICDALWRLPADAFANGPRNQIGPDLMFGSITVVDLDSAIEALQTIIEQGEGTSTSPVEVDGPGGVNDVAHFYRLMEIREGRRLVTKNDCFEFTGDPVDFDPAGVFHVPDDPSRLRYLDDPVALALNDAFNATYTTLLATIHELVNGSTTMTTFMEALRLMESLEAQARDMVAGVGHGGVPVGPSFEYLA